MRSATIAELEDWEQGGAVWQPVEITPERAVVDLCSCSGEPMDRVQSADPGFIEFVRTHPRG
jgi:prephenate dehydrogenase